ncbi:MAG: hypothetical protein IPK82_08025 [Polyangiaceae bacterium]|nr:hypothetical protein [Polyangiaceae bacterium]
MATTKLTASKKAPPGASKKATSGASKKLPAALAANAAKSAAAKRQRLADEARADIALIRARRQRIVEDFYDIGEALLRLRRPGVAESLGYKGFLDLCRVELDMSANKASQLIGIVQAVPREQARALGQERAAALLSLAQATPEQDSVVSLAQGKLLLPSGEKLDIAKASARALRDAAKAVRHAGDKTVKKTSRGVSTTAKERELAAALEKALRDLGVEEARVTAVARAGGGAHARIDRVPLASLDVLGKAAAQALKRVGSIR